MSHNEEAFAGHKKDGQSLLGDIEKKAIDWAVPKIPESIRTYHLTLCTIPISLLIVLFGYMAKFNDHWLWLVSVLIFLQWVTDGLDGAVGRARNEGFIKWGYYMDHFLDYIFLCAILIAYMLMLPDQSKWIHFFVLAVFGAFMVNAYLDFAATNRFRIAYYGIGPTEVRITFIVINTLLILVGKTYMSGALPYILGLATLGLCVVVFRTQKIIWALDMEEKKRSGSRSDDGAASLDTITRQDCDEHLKYRHADRDGGPQEQTKQA